MAPRDAPEVSRGRPEDRPGSPQVRLGTSRRSPEVTRETPKRPRGPPEEAPRRPKAATNLPRGRPRVPEALPSGPRGAPEGPQAAPRASGSSLKPLKTIFLFQSCQFGRSYRKLALELDSRKQSSHVPVPGSSWRFLNSPCSGLAPVPMDTAVTRSVFNPPYPSGIHGVLFLAVGSSGSWRR